MRNTQEIKKFIEKWQNFHEPCSQILYDYKPICRDLLYHDEELVIKTLNILKKNIKEWANIHCPIYKNRTDSITDKYLLWHKDKWYVPHLSNQAAKMKSSGSTTGHQFDYLRWDPFLYFIEGTNHYDLILDEFNITKKDPHIMYFFQNQNHDKNLLVKKSNNSENFLEHHGISRKSTIHYVNLQLQKKYEDLFFKHLFDYIEKNPIDVIFSNGPQINKLCDYLKKYKYNKKLCKLLSNTNEMILKKDHTYLLGNNHVTYICDHMRCWDGGATFFTCIQGRYHLLDNLSWCDELDTKLISTDYFSMPSPFVNYWNGDRCKIDKEYKKCECGRLYREFTFLENRPFAIKGNSFKEYKEKLLNCGISTIKQVVCNVNTIEINSSAELSTLEKQQVEKIFNKQKVVYKTIK